MLLFIGNKTNFINCLTKRDLCLSFQIEQKTLGGISEADRKAAKIKWNNSELEQERRITLDTDDVSS